VSTDAVAEEVTHQVIDESCQLASRLLTTAENLRTRRDTATRRRFARLLDDPDGLAVTMALADEVMRTPSSREAARILRRSAKLARARGLGVIDAVGLRLLAVASALAAAPVMNVIAQTVRMRANGIILPADARRLTRHIRRRRDDRARLNINVLGEAVLGDNEADTRYRAVMEMIARPDVDYVSVKLSAIVAQLITVDRDGSLNRIAERLRPLYRAAMGCNTFVNLDMEEYRDLEITLRSFMSILDEPEFERLTAGIVLQAYLPEAHEALQRLTSWARARHARSGGVIKVRLVKGANLAMESTEAELHGWVAAPYSTKSDVDASYVRMLDSVVNERDAVAVRVGVASHNLFHLAFALTLAKRRGVSSQIDIEMLEGMANAEALALAREAGSVILYTPVTSRDDFPAAVAYLVRRLDENTSTENYLRASFSMHPGNDAWRQQQLRFVASVRESATISTTSRRHGLIRTDADAEFGRLRFANQGDGDPTNITELPFGATMQIPQVDVATANEVGGHVATARRAQAEWAAAGATKRAQILRVAARIMQQERRDTIALMMREAGKTFAEADPEVSEAIDFARFYALEGQRVCADPTASALGVVLVVPPWNFPYAIPAGGVCAALATGNSVILKPAPETVAIAQRLVQQLWAAGVPHDVLRFVRTHDDEVGRGLVTNTGVDCVVLTGGYSTARVFLEWRPDMRLLAETSGKNAIVVTASADVDAAVKDIVQSAFGHAGQKCSAASLAIVDAEVFDHSSFLRQLRDAVESLQVGWGDQPSTNVGPLIRAPGEALERALHHLDVGESWLVQPRQLLDDARLYRPGVRLGVQPGSWSHHNEWFGPVLAVMRAPDLDTAIEWQNAVAFGLTAGVHALNAQDCERWIAQVRAGNLYVNRGTTGAVVNRQPFGGWRKSSVGPTAKAGGVHYVETLMNWAAVDTQSDAQVCINSARAWWTSIGSVARDVAGLRAERNYCRYVPYDGVVVVADQSVSASTRRVVDDVSQLLTTPVHWMTASEINVTELRNIIMRKTIERVRWLSSVTVPHEVVALLVELGISLDRRALAINGGVEAPRWLKEQSIAITNHRHGNIGAGPRVEVPNSLSV